MRNIIPKVVGFGVAMLCFGGSVYVMASFTLGVAASGYSGLGEGQYGKPRARPFVYRVLVPAVAQAVVDAVPKSVREPLTQQLTVWRDGAYGLSVIDHFFVHPLPLSDVRIFETAVVLCVVYASLCLFFSS